MLQKIEGIDVYVVEFETLPQYVITWDSEEEKPYAMALEHALHNDVIQEPGKYAIHIDQSGDDISYQVFQVTDP